jgi:hypothetical protein
MHQWNGPTDGLTECRVEYGTYSQHESRYQNLFNTASRISTQTYHWGQLAVVIHQFMGWSIPKLYPVFSVHHHLLLLHPHFNFDFEHHLLDIFLNLGLCQTGDRKGNCWKALCHYLTMSSSIFQTATKVAIISHKSGTTSGHKSGICNTYLLTYLIPIW